MRPRTWIAVLAAAALIAALSGCGDDARTERAAAREASPSPIRIGTKNFTEQFILGELYRQALEARGFAVALKSDIGSSEIVHEALRGGALDMYPEYVGVLLSEIANVRRRPSDPAAAFRMAKAYEERHGFTLLAATPFSDANALVVTPDFARRHGVRRIADLARVPGGATIGAPPEFRTRVEGLVGLRRRYGLAGLRVRPLAIGDQYDALDRRRVDAAAVFTTDGQLADRRYVVLRDPRRVFAAQHATPVINRRVLRKHGPGLAAAIDAVSRRLTTAAMRDMNADVELGGARPAAVADRFLRAQGLK